MIGYELIKETFLRKSYIPALHVLWMVAQVLILMSATEPGFAAGKMLFVMVGLLFPLLISAGIFGDDIASGRMVVLMTRPVRFTELYLWRLIGLIIQCILQLSLGGLLAMVICGLAGNASPDHLLHWMLLSLVLAASVASLATAVSVIAPRGYNFTILLLCMMVVFAVRINLPLIGGAGAAAFQFMVKYLLPPVESLYTYGGPAATRSEQLGAIFSAFVLVALYAALGIILLSRREFRREPD